MTGGVTRILAAVAMCCFPALVSAATLETEITPEMAEMGCTARLSGVIEDGDLERIRPFLESSLSPGWGNDNYVEALVFRNFSPATDYGDGFFAHRLCLDSPGGSLEEALRIVEYFRVEHSRTLGGIPTAIARGDICESACAYVFFAGRFIRFSGAASYEGRSNALLHPEGRLGLHAPFIPVPAGTYTAEDIRAIWDVGMNATALISRQIGNGNLFLSFDLYFEMLTYEPSELLVIDTVGEAVQWGVEVEATLLNYGGSYDISEAAYYDGFCRNAATLVPDFVDLVAPQFQIDMSPGEQFQLTSGAVFQDRLSGRNYRCIVAEGQWESLSFVLENRAADLLARPQQWLTRLWGAGGVSVRFETDSECGNCGLEVFAPDIAVFPPDTLLSDISVPLR